MHRCSARSTLFPYTTLFRSIVKNVIVAERRFLVYGLRSSTPFAVFLPEELIDLADEMSIRLDPKKPVPPGQDRKSTRLNSSHLGISYAVFCLKKKKEK